MIARDISYSPRFFFSGWSIGSEAPPRIPRRISMDISGPTLVPNLRISYLLLKKVMKTLFSAYHHY